jgi:hypothetical protein
VKINPVICEFCALLRRKMRRKRKKWIEGEEQRGQDVLGDP